MIIDAHAHLMMDAKGEFASSRSDNGTEVLLRNMNECGIDKSVIFTIDFRTPSYKTNNRIAEVVRENPHRFIGFGTVHPFDGGRAIKEVERCVAELGLKGLKFHPWVQAFRGDDPSLDPIIHKAIQLELPVFFHTGTLPYTHPFQIAVWAEKYPKLILIMGHMGLGSYWRDALHAAEKFPNIYLETCGLPYGKPVKIALERIGAHRIVFGSDNSLLHPRPEVAKIRSLEISEKDKISIMGGNMKRLLCL
ncbi:MAG: amidohydrolase [Firmicutes bacterium]|nr:amidohydrolase [Bacillota bacterium]